MKLDQAAQDQIASTLSNRFDSMFYVEIESGHFGKVIPPTLLQELNIPDEGEDFFGMVMQNAPKCVHPSDMEKVRSFLDRESVLENLKDRQSISVNSRIISEGRTIYIRHVNYMCADRKHLLFCMENIDDDMREKEEQREILLSAQRMARRDELTGIRNKNAFAEKSEEINKLIRSAKSDLRVGIVVCDINDLKKINDTRGHNFGDEVIQRASRMISGTFVNSEVFRIGGDEFVVLLQGEDYMIREELLEIMRAESVSNGRSRSGPVVASGMAVYDPKTDAKFSDVFKRADIQMYENKNSLKDGNPRFNLRSAHEMDIPIPDDRKRALDSLFGALFTMAGEGYVFLNDLRYDYSRWSLALVDDFGLISEYMYHAGRIWEAYVHPEDIDHYKGVIDAVIAGESDMDFLCYRARTPDGTYITIKPRAFVMSDKDGNPEYFGGILVPQ